MLWRLSNSRALDALCGMLRSSVRDIRGNNGIAGKFSLKKLFRFPTPKIDVFSNFVTKVAIKDFPVMGTVYNSHSICPNHRHVRGIQEYLLVPVEVFYFEFSLKVVSTKKSILLTVAVHCAQTISRSEIIQ